MWDPGLKVQKIVSNHDENANGKDRGIEEKLAPN